MSKADDSGLLPQRVWLPDSVVQLAAVSPELENVEGAYWVRADSQPVPAESSEYVKGLRDAAKAMCMFCADPNRYTPAQWEQGTYGFVGSAIQKIVNVCIQDGREKRNE